LNKDLPVKLFYVPGYCSLAAHIVLREAELSFKLVSVDLLTGATGDGRDFNAINPKGYVPALELDDGQVITEVAAIVQYLADLKPESRLVPVAGTFERTRLKEWLNFIATELHKGMGQLFEPQISGAWLDTTRATLEKRLEFLAACLKRSPFLMGSVMTVADIYLYVVLSWAVEVNLDLSRWEVLSHYLERIGARPSVQAALQAEGLKAA